MKVYLAQLTHRITKKVIYKCGYVKHQNAAKRFDGDEYKDFDIEILGSINISNPSYDKAVEYCKEIEQYLQKKFPKNFWIENYLGVERGYYDGLSGITEMFILEKGQTKSDVVSLFYKVKDRVDANPKFRM